MNTIDFDNIEKVKLIYSQINNNKLFSSMFILSMSKLAYTELQKMYIIDTTMDKEKYDFNNFTNYL